MLPATTDVLIVGAGPTGLALAVALRQAGIDPLLVDRLSAGQNTSRAAVIHAHTLEVLDSIAVTGELARRGILVSRFTVRDRDRPLVSLRFDRIDSPHRHLMMVTQDVTETVLAERFAQLGGVVRRGVTATAVAEGPDGVTVRLDTPEGERTVTARYVVGADGMHSMVREAAGIPFTGAEFDHSFVLADVRMEWPLRDTEVSLFFSPKGLVVVAPLAGGLYRIVATLDPAPETPTVDDVQKLLDARGPTRGRMRVSEVIWGSRFRLHHRVVDRYRAGRLLLMGDAAHVHSPAGGQGMNTGLVDAIVLARLLARVVRGGEPDSVLDAYERLRRPAAVEVLALSGRLTRLATMRGTLRLMLRNAGLRLLDSFAPAKRRLVRNLSGISRRGYSRAG